MGIPPALWTSFCPFRVLRDKRTEQWLIMFGRYQRFGFPPDVDELPERDVKAMDVMSLSLQLPLAETDGHNG